MGHKGNIGSFLIGLQQGSSPYLQALLQHRMGELERKNKLADLLAERRQQGIDEGSYIPAPKVQIGTTIDKLSLLPGMASPTIQNPTIPRADISTSANYPSTIQPQATFRLGGEGYMPKPVRTKWEPGTQKQAREEIAFKTDEEIRKENAKNKNIQDTTIVPEGFEIVGYSAKGQPIIKKIDIDKQNKREQTLKQQQQATEYIRSTAQDTLDTIGEIEKGINHFGLTGGIPSIPGTDRYVWQSNINKLLSGKMIDLMTKMKEASKTGATGFGQLSEKEGQILREASTALKRGMPPSEAQKILNKMKIPLQKVLIEGSDINTGQPTTDQFQIGQTIQKGGKTYKYIGNGQWSY